MNDPLDLPFAPFTEMDFSVDENNLVKEIAEKYMISPNEVELLVLFAKNMESIMKPGSKDTEIGGILDFLQDRSKIQSVIFKHGKGNFKIEGSELIQILLKQTLKYHWLSKYFNDKQTFKKENVSIVSDNNTILQCTKHLKNRLLPQVDKLDTGKPNQTTVSAIICEIYAFYKIKIRDGILSEKEYNKNNLSYRKYADDRIRAIIKSR